MSFPVKMWSGLIEEKHFRAMGSSIWLYLWILARITKEIEGKGYVLGGKPIKDAEVVEDFGTNEKTIRRWRNRLQKMSYLESYKTPYGMVYFVNKSKKFKWGETKLSRTKDKTVQNKLRYKEDIKDNKSNSIYNMEEFPFLKDEEFSSTLKDYLDMRNKIKKPATDKAIELALKKLHSYEKTTAKKMLEQSIMNSWQGIFPLKQQLQTQGDKRWL